MVNPYGLFNGDDKFWTADGDNATFNIRLCNLGTRSTAGMWKRIHWHAIEVASEGLGDKAQLLLRKIKND